MSSRPAAFEQDRATLVVFDAADTELAQFDRVETK